MSRSQSGGRGPLLLVLVALVAGAGGWNFHRNWKAEQSEPRPFQTYSVGDLEALSAAYESELAGLQGAAATRGPTAVRDTRFGEGHREFERVHRASAATRSLTGEVAHQEKRLTELREELALRSQDPMRVFMRRLLTL